VPELPEVETIARGLRPGLVGRVLGRTTVRWTRSLGGLSRRALARALAGKRVRSVGRRGKFVVIALERAGAAHGALLVHLRMSGRLSIERGDRVPSPYLRVSVALDDGRALDFVDVRKFGRFCYARDPEKALRALGPEPLAEAFTAGALHAALRARRRALKPLLLDQTFLAGLGNIYVDESLHRSGLHPLLSSERCDRDAADRLHESIRTVLAEAIAREGSSFDAFYRTPEGRPGSYQHLFRVYARAGQPCFTCGTPIRRVVVGQRGTHFCPRCQRPPRKRRRAR
jgi:formamidopyrimidine-DNA glycosylase